MRMIGHLEDETRARGFSDFLYVQGIDNEVEAERGGGWAVWVRDEDQIETATAMLARFRENPADPAYREAARTAREQRELEARKDEEARKRHFDRRKLFPAGIYGVGLLTAALVAVSVAVGIVSRGAISQRAMDDRIVQPLSITQYEITGHSVEWQGGLPEIRSGQIWRLLTPIFLHFGPVHLLFNMLCLLDLGSMVERRQSSRLLLALVLVIAAASNLAQYFVGRTPSFGGMSGVVYGLIGYIWLRGKFDPGSRLLLHPHAVTMALIWFFACLANVIPHVANTAHAVGLGLGMAWGFVSATIANRR